MTGEQVQHPLVSLVRASVSVAVWILAWARTLVAFATISVPRFVYSILSYSLTLRLDFRSLVLLFVLSGILVSHFIRYRYLSTHCDHSERGPLSRPAIEPLHPDVQGNEAREPFHNYLDEFLLAIRVFGFLEKPVFHELARYLQTRRLIAGDTLSLHQDKNFYCVIDGLVQVFAKTDGREDDAVSTWEGEDLNGYQLLNEVGSGGTLSSLFTILSLFTENVQLTWPEETYDHDVAEDFVDQLQIPDFLSRSRANSDVSLLQLNNHDSRPGRTSGRTPASSSSGSTIHAAANVPLPRSGSHSTSRSAGRQSMGSVDGSEDSRSTWRAKRPSLRRSKTTFPSGLDRAGGSVARATVDTTLAVIPAEAFRRLTSKYPKMILARFTRVTFMAAHKYLGLTSELLRTEKAINDLACHPLPLDFYRRGGMEKLRQRFAPDPKEPGSDTSSSDSDYFGSAANGHIIDQTNTVAPSSVTDSPPSGPSNRRMHPNAGDLHSSAIVNSEAYLPLTRSESVLFTPAATRHASGEQTRKNHLHSDDFDLREQVMDCIVKCIGLVQPPSVSAESVEASPAFGPMDQFGRPAFTTSFSSLSLLQAADDASSVTASSVNAQSPNVIENEVEILFFRQGDTLVHAGERDAGELSQVSGAIKNTALINKRRMKSKIEAPQDASAQKPNPMKHLFDVKAGGIAGYLASLSETASYVEIRAKTDTYVGFLPHKALMRLLEKRPIVLLTLAKRLISLLSPLVLQIDSALDWVQVSAGQVLWRPGETSDSFYIVINGRLRVLGEDEKGNMKVLNEFGQGETVGELDVITSSPRTTTLHAIRDTELVRMPLTLFNAISVRHPKTTIQLLRMIATRVKESASGSKPETDIGKNPNLKTVAILPTAKNVPVAAFAKKLQTALEEVGAPTSYLTQASVTNHLGAHAFTKMGKLKIAAWLADQEQRYRIVLYVADSPVNAQWTQTCIHQADSIMLVCMGNDPSIGEYERLLLSTKTTARKELILLHPGRHVVPGSTREWLKIRPWIHTHFHVELPGMLGRKPPTTLDPTGMAAFKKLKKQVEVSIGKYRGPRPVSRRPDSANDFSRLARRLIGKSVGVVLGGGGARGISHLGVLRALEEQGIPVDMIGGTSIGAFVSGLYAHEADLFSSIGRAKHFSGRMANIWRIISDVTYPIVAYTTGHEFNRSIYKSFYDLHIEDMWLPFFCNTTNILTSTHEIHTSGYAWRYIRASMTLVGLLPPLSDNGKVLVSTMISMGASAVVAVDVGAVDDTTPRDFGDSISGWWLLINRLNPFSSTPGVPPITEIQSRLAYVSSVKTLADAKVMKGCWYMPVPVQEFTTLQFGKFEEIFKRGYEAATKMLEDWKETNNLPTWSDEEFKETEKRRKGRGLRRNSI
ncbi:uncharacterized protein EI90DRAFT_3146562 [Cantharellus anzutake]|uniref:uncharacterized protein n=1 Tax=Cantharellus anzutake TaxID=1750568 RepID=UPI001908A78B|nr:uncharacterized protein EI90DRAFT_3146562 [Cantharellus anzutake]KAF8326402.1 hypothetical protein EI90DRAFT_3146562 [Cantharellus anzutake]